MSQSDDSSTGIKEIVFYSKRVEKDFKETPEKHQVSFMHNLSMVAHGMAPSMNFDHLESAGAGCIELKINGSPAYRCVYYNKLPGKVVVVHVTEKTTNGSDPKILKLVKDRVKKLKKT
jgi:phage-related protein